ncbi:HAD family phosphatase [Pantoea sp. 1.19]|uniref:HAD family hydrolase n=1 Tax=Pantoea sp. 1.19 TaxID=1925589 RepID=UPI0009489268|nr:HAD family phosphatase [Pantoea sp. 1.19]
MTPFSVIFDIDGVVVDSEQLHFDVLAALLPDHTRGVSASQLIGLSLEETLLKIGIDTGQHGDLTRRIVAAYQAALGPRYLRPDIGALVHGLSARGIPFGFVSTAPRDICLANLATLALPQTPPLVAGDDLTRTKPWPDPYLAMLTRLDVTAEQTIVVEDTDLGIQAATAAGIRQVYGWPHALSDGERYTQAHAVIRTLGDIPPFNAILTASTLS